MKLCVKACEKGVLHANVKEFRAAGHQDVAMTFQDSIPEVCPG